MRTVILSSSVFSETACAIAAHLADQGHIPVGAVALSSLNYRTILRKIGQWGITGVATYARRKISPRLTKAPTPLRNPYLRSFLTHGSSQFHSLREIATSLHFPLVMVGNQNSEKSVDCLRSWSPDLIIFAGGDILRKQVLDAPRLGIMNMHLGLLPEVRGMSTPEWSLLLNVPLGITIHLMDAGIDTGPILRRYEFRDTDRCRTLADLRNRLIAFGIEKLAEVVIGLDRGILSVTPQPHIDSDRQFFVMHTLLRNHAQSLLAKSDSSELQGINLETRTLETMTPEVKHG
jgi:folate-dependent phosphoribosylglycinamide formyltransferase PurN